MMRISIPSYWYKNSWKKYKYFGPAAVACLVGHILDVQQDNLLRDFHNKSKLWGGVELKEGEDLWR